MVEEEIPKPTEEGDNVESNVPKNHRRRTSLYDFVFSRKRVSAVLLKSPCWAARRHMGKSRDLSEFERGMIVGARSAGCSISETVNRLGFSKTAVSRVYREWCEKQKTSSHRGSCGRKRLVDDNGERKMERVVEANNRATSVQIQALYNSSGQEKPISLTTTRRTLKRLGYSRRAQRRDSLVLAGLEALAAYTSCPEQRETSTDLVCSNENDPDPRSQSSTDLSLVCSNENDADPLV